MAIAYLNPASISSGGSGWSESDPSYLDQGQTSNYWSAPPGKTVAFNLSNFDNTGVASIDTVQLIMVGASGQKGQVWRARMTTTTSAGNLFDSFVVTTSGGTYSGTARSVNYGSAAWTDSFLDEMIISMNQGGMANPGIVQQFYIKVTYTEAGYGNAVNGVAAANIGKVNGVATANIEKVNGV